MAYIIFGGRKKKYELTPLNKNLLDFYLTGLIERLKIKKIAIRAVFW